jgi:hypothetical protein
MVADITTELTALNNYLTSKGKHTTARIVQKARSEIDRLRNILQVRNSDEFKAMAEAIALSIVSDIESARQAGNAPPQIAGIKLLYKTDKEVAND